MPLPRLARDRELDALLDAALTTLERAGFLVQDEELRALMVSAGCRPADGGRVLIPRELVSEMLAPRIASAGPPPDGPPRTSGDYRGGIATQIAQFYLDPETNARVGGDSELLAELARFGHVWQPGQSVGPVLLCRDVPPPVEPMEAVAVIARNTDRVSTGYCHEAAQIPYLAELGRILWDDKNRFLHICVFAVTPLRMDLRACRLVVELTRSGAATWIGTQPAAGASSPVTVAGTVVLGVAEILAGWCATYAVDRGAMPGAGICSGVLDMATADVCYCAPETMLQDLLCCEVFRERCGGRCNVAGGAAYTHAKQPGIQKAFEIAFEALTIYTCSGAWPSGAVGLLESGKTFSPVQFILDHDFGGTMHAFGRGVDITTETIALDDILAVGTGIGESHLGTDHTLGHFRELYRPELLDRSAWRGDAIEAGEDERLLRRAAERFREVRARYQPASVGDEKLAAIDGVLADARRHLC
jgi:trimethylamine---corrinoid protein Co-methyltransferase